MLETALVFDPAGHSLHWHLPKGRGPGYLPDSPDLWDVLWNHRYNLGGVAHTHPEGILQPSWEDVGTFAAVERGLGQRLLWPIATAERMVWCTWRGPSAKDYVWAPHCEGVSLTLEGLGVLRALSRAQWAVQLWLDDCRPAPKGWVWARTAAEAILVLEQGSVQEISLDHDLGDPNVTGYTVACWIEAQAAEGKEPPSWHVHSANPVGKKRMALALESAERQWKECK